VSSLVCRDGPDPARERAGRVRRISAWIESDSPYDVECALLAANGALSLTVTPPCHSSQVLSTPLVSFARSTYHLTANVSYISFLL